MQFTAKFTQINQHKTHCAVVFVAGDKVLSRSALVFDEQHNGHISALLSSGDLRPKAGSTAWLFLPSDSVYTRLLVVNLGKDTKSLPKTREEDFRKAVTSAAKAITSSPAKDATLYFDDLSVDKKDVSTLAAIVSQTFTTENYRFTECKSEKKDPPKLKKLTLVGHSTGDNHALKQGLAMGSAIGQGVNLARDLGNLPGNICTPVYLAEQAKALANKSAKLTSRIVSDKQMEKLGMHSLLSVANGSEQPARLIIMEYRGESTKNTQPHVLVGKGITFDTGGISLKPGAGMDEMKFDMCGAASVFGAIKALCAMDAKVSVVGIVAAAENMPGSRATKPGDIVKSLSGQTIEILNTDAEGRLVLCDALTYAERFKPKTVIDIATLTGACVVALGKHASGLYSNNQALADSLLNAGEETKDRAWQMPLWDDYQSQLDSNFADMANIGGREAGSITAACFLSRFTKKFKWAHLDIAGTAWHSGVKKGATGRPVSLLVNYLLS